MRTGWSGRRYALADVSRFQDLFFSRENPFSLGRDGRAPFGGTDGVARAIRRGAAEDEQTLAVAKL